MIVTMDSIADLMLSWASPGGTIIHYTQNWIIKMIYLIKNKQFTSKILLKFVLIFD